jgi:hypothetical protein
VLEAAVLLVLVSGALKVFSYSHVSGALKLLAAPGPLFVAADRMRSDRIAWAVGVVSARIPFVTCLTSALVLQALLERSGQSARVCFGVARPLTDELSAHAWVEDGFGATVGRSRRGAFVPLVRFSDTQ